jgi:capsular exopolysaccharide synthesis family protein
MRLLRKRWYVVAVYVIVGLVAGLAVSAVVPPTYDARATLYFSTVVTGPASGTVSAYETNLLAEQQVKTISLLVDTERVAQDVVDDLGLSMTAAELIPHVTATSDPETVVLAVDATDSSPQRAADIANSTARALVRLTDTINKENAAANLPTVLPSVRAEVIQAAIVPATPSAGTRTANLLGGLLGGLLVGLAVVLLREVLNRKVRTGDELAALSAAPAMGSTPRSAAVKLRPIAVVDDTDGEFASAHRQLRVNIGVAMAGSRVLAVVSPGSGDGRSLTVCNLAVAFAESGCRVAVLEADLRRPRLGDYLGFDDETGLAEVLAGARTTDEVVRSWRGCIDVVLAGSERLEPGRLVASGRMLAVLEELKADHDVVLVDTPAASAASDVAVLGARTDAVLLLARQGRSRRAEVERLVEAVRLASGNVIGSVLTMEKSGRFRRRPAPLHLPSRPAAQLSDFDAPTLRNTPAAQVAPAPPSAPADDAELPAVLTTATVTPLAPVTAAVAPASAVETPGVSGAPTAVVAAPATPATTSPAPSGSDAFAAPAVTPGTVPQQSDPKPFRHPAAASFADRGAGKP